jgi:hypothetical protein
VPVIRTRDRDALLQALRAGVVPRVGQHLIQVGRSKELAALIADIGRITEGSAIFRLIIGEYGSGKTFFLNLVRAIALEKKLAVASADLNPDRRLHASGGQARSLYAELMRNLATRSKPDGGALSAIVEKFVSEIAHNSTEANVPERVIRARLEPLSEMVGGYDFAAVIASYWRGFDSGDDVLKMNAVRWLKGEFATKTEAREALKVRSIIDDTSVYDQLKLLARFVRLAGYSGLLVCLDELVNLYKLSNTQARNANYEQILRILNDVLQNPPEGLGVLMGGTPEFLLDTRKGLYGYPALQSRLAENTFANKGLVDYTGPVLRLGSLSQEEFFVLLQKLREVYAAADPARSLLPDEALTAFMTHCHQKLGETYFRTPRTTITSFINLLSVLEQNPSKQWRYLVTATDVHPDVPPSLEPIQDEDTHVTGTVPQPPPSVTPPADDEFATFEL